MYIERVCLFVAIFWHIKSIGLQVSLGMLYVLG